MLQLTPFHVLLAISLLTAATPANSATVETFATLPARFEDISIGPDESVYVPSFPAGGIAIHIELDGTQTTIATGLQAPFGGVVDSDSNYYVSCFNANHIHKIHADGTESVCATAPTPTGLLFSEDEQTLYVSCYNPGYVLEIDVATGVKTIIASGASILGPDGLAMDEAGNLYIANFLTSQITKLDAGGTESVFATLPGGQTGYIDYRNETLYVAGIDTHKIYQVDTVSGDISTLAGTGVPGSTDGDAEAAQINNPNGLALSKDGETLWFQAQNELRRIHLSDPAAVDGAEAGNLSESMFAFPNPFTKSTRVSYSLPKSGLVKASVYDSEGSRVRGLGSHFQTAGLRSWNWDGKSAKGEPVRAGVYYLRIQTESSSYSTRVIRVR